MLVKKGGFESVVRCDTEVYFKISTVFQNLAGGRRPRLAITYPQEISFYADYRVDKYSKQYPHAQ